MLTLVMPYYKNAGMLREHYRRWDNAAYGSGWPESIAVILVDDGTPPESGPVESVPVPASLRRAVTAYRVDEDRPWWQHGARNIGAYEAVVGMLLLTDMDHFADLEVLQRCAALADTCWYRFPRINHKDLSSKPPHPNSWLIHSAAFWDIGGYDEDYCGHYGTDSEFRNRAIAKLGLPLLLSLEHTLELYSRTDIHEASTSCLPRKEGRTIGWRTKVRALKAANGRPNTPLSLSRPYRRVI